MPCMKDRKKIVPNKTIPKNASQSARTQRPLDDIADKCLGLNDQEFASQPFVALKYYKPKHQCFSKWSREELKAFSAFTTKLRSHTWAQITGSHKVGLGYDVHKNPSKLPEAYKELKNEISPEINFFELRVTDKARVHGFRAGDAFFLVWLDRNHEIYPCKD